MAVETANQAYSDTLLHIGGTWRAADRQCAVINPATESQIGQVALAGQAELQAAVEAARAGFAIWGYRPIRAISGGLPGKDLIYQ